MKRYPKNSSRKCKIAFKPFLLATIWGVFVFLYIYLELKISKIVPYYGEFFYPNSLIGIGTNKLDLIGKEAINTVGSSVLRDIVYNGKIQHQILALLPKFFYLIGFNVYEVIRLEFATIVALSYTAIYLLINRLSKDKKYLHNILLSTILTFSPLIWIDAIYCWDNYLSVAILPIFALLILLHQSSNKIISIVKFIALILIFSITVLNPPLFLWVAIALLCSGLYLQKIRHYYFNYICLSVAVLLVSSVFFAPMILSFGGAEISGSAGFASYIVPTIKNDANLLSKYFFSKNWFLIIYNGFFIIVILRYLIQNYRRANKSFFIPILFMALPLIMEVIAYKYSGVVTDSSLIRYLSVLLYQPYRKAGVILLLGAIIIVSQIRPSKKIPIIFYPVLSVAVLYCGWLLSPLKNYQVNLTDNSYFKNFEQMATYVNKQYPNDKIAFFPFKGRMRNIADNILVLDGELARAFKSETIFDSPGYYANTDSVEYSRLLNQVKDIEELNRLLSQKGINTLIIFKGSYKSYFNDQYLNAFAVEFPAATYIDINEDYALYRFDGSNGERYIDFDLSQIDLSKSNNVAYVPDSKTLSPKKIGESSTLDLSNIKTDASYLDILAYATYPQSNIVLFKKKGDKWQEISRINGSESGKNVKLFSIPLNQGFDYKVEMTSAGPTVFESGIKLIRLDKIDCMSEKTISDESYYCFGKDI